MRYLLLLLLALPVLAQYARQEPLALRGAAANAARVPVYGLFQLTLDLSATYDNPFDPAQIDVHADFTAPSGKVSRAVGFFSRDFAWSTDAKPRLLPGAYAWQVRFTPDAPGAWRYTVTATDRSGTVALPAATFTATPAATPGFLRRVGTRFAHDDASAFTPIGLDMCWGPQEPGAGYTQWLPALGQAGGNWVRVWMWQYHLGLEWKADTRPDGYRGAGRYNLENAWRLDHLLDLAAEQGVNVQLCLGTYGDFTTGGYFHEGQWPNNPYNAANGGPCAKPEDFWTDADARRLYQQRLRYLAARYACRTNLFGWEFWNEAHAPAAWTAEMARYLKSTDPHRHLVTTSYGDDATWALPDIDYTQTHHYGMGDVADHAPVAIADAAAHAKYGKPHLLAEFGIDWREADTKYDPTGAGVNLHNGLWAGLLGGDAGTGMIWYWDNYVAPKALFHEFTAVRRVADAIPWGVGTWTPAQTESPVADGPETWSDLTLTADSGWGKSATAPFTVTPAGLHGTPPVPQFLYGPKKTDLHAEPSFTVTFPHAGDLVLRVDTVSTPTTLRCRVDGVPVGTVTLNPEPPQDPAAKAPYEKTEYKAEWKVYQAVFNTDARFPVPAGAHTVTLDVPTGDWLSLRRLTFTGCRSSRYPALTLCGVTNGHAAALWVHHAGHTWMAVHDGAAIPPITGARTALTGLPDGTYRVVWYDTESGAFAPAQHAACRKGRLPLSIPTLATDAAVVVTRE